MKKSELAGALAVKAGLTKTESNSILTALTDLIGEELSKGEKIQLTGLGTWSVRQRKERNGVNPSTGEKIRIPAKKVPAFKASSSLIQKVS